MLGPTSGTGLAHDAEGAALLGGRTRPSVAFTTPSTVGSGRQVADGRSWTRFSRLGVADPWVHARVDDGVEHVDDDVGDDHERAEQEHQSDVVAGRRSGSPRPPACRRPLKLNTVSVMIAPPSRPAKSRPIRVTSGVSAARMLCDEHRTARGPLGPRGPGCSPRSSTPARGARHPDVARHEEQRQGDAGQAGPAATARRRPRRWRVYSGIGTTSHLIATNFQENRPMKNAGKA